MRVVGGSARGMTLQVVPGRGTRPILDRVKTTLFDILRPRLEGRHVLDLFAGSGSVGIEALSQGAGRCTFLDMSDRAIATIKKNLATTGLSGRATVRLADALRYLRETPESFDLAYVAPPQYRGLWVEAMRRLDERPELLRGPAGTSAEEPADPLVIVQIDPREYQALDLGAFRETRQKRIGNTLLVFYEPSGAGPPEPVERETSDETAG
jgi:16S rRNA (guanine966-N2)-methyltransferase